MSKPGQRAAVRPRKQAVIAPPSPGRWSNFGWKRLALGAVFLFVGLGLLSRFEILNRSGPWDVFDKPREAGAKRVVGVVEAVSIDNESICIKPKGEQICGTPQMTQTVPSVGQKVIAYYTFVPNDPSGDPRSLVWVAMFPAE